ncbi:hypothetical protein HDV02_004003, partial [Globomyces sp. JEL0801]
SEDNEDTKTFQNEDIHPYSHKSTPALSEAINSLKRKETDELSILQEKSKIMKTVKEIVKDMAGDVHSVDSDYGKQFTFRVSKICDMISELSTAISTKPSTTQVDVLPESDT